MDDVGKKPAYAVKWHANLRNIEQIMAIRRR